MRELHRPVARHAHLPVEQPLRRLLDLLGVLFQQPGVVEGEQRQHRIPDGAVGGLDEGCLAFVHTPAWIVERVQPLGQDRMIDGIAFVVQRHQAVNPRRLNAAPGAVGVLMPDDPFKRVPDGRTAPQAHPELVPGILQGVQHPVSPAEEAVPCVRASLLRQIVIERLAPAREQRIKPVFRRQRPAGMARGEHGNRHQRGASPLREIIDGKRKPEREPDDFWRSIRGLLPRPFADQRQPIAGEDADIAQTALRSDPFERLGHRGLIVAMPERAQSRVGFHRCVDVAIRRAVVDLPGAVRPLRLQERVAEAPAQGMAVEAEEPQSEAPLRLHAGVRFRARHPMAVRLLPLDQPAGRRPHGGLHRRVEIVGAGRASLRGVRHETVRRGIIVCHRCRCLRCRSSCRANKQTTLVKVKGRLSYSRPF